MNRARWPWILAPLLGLFGSSCVVTTDSCTDTDLDGYCDDDDCYPTDGVCWDCGDPLCDAAGCTTADNFCPDPWYINYCDTATGGMLEADCYVSCTTDARVYAQTCGGTPAVTGECLTSLGSCGCWCQEAFDVCVDADTVQYERDGTTYQVNCLDYCGGYCDEVAGACAC